MSSEPTLAFLQNTLIMQRKSSLLYDESRRYAWYVNNDLPLITLNIYIA